MEAFPVEDDRKLIRPAADAILHAFGAYQAEFTSITRRAKRRFEDRDWHAAQKDAVERLDLYQKVIHQIVGNVREILADRTQARSIWSRMKAEYSQMIANRDDFELAETFFNSVTRRIFITVGVDPAIEFVDSDFEVPPPSKDKPIYKTYLPEGTPGSRTIQTMIEGILSDYPFRVGYLDASRDARIVAVEIHRQLYSRYSGAARRDSARLERIELIRPVFYRGHIAYLIGRICLNPVHSMHTASQAGEEEQQAEPLIPFILCLINTDRGIEVDAIVLDEDEASIVFSFTRSYFHVEAQRPHELVGFLKSIMPLKRVAELYISIGYNKHGKTELYRDLLKHLANSSDRFDIARGERGMVMVVFTMANYDVVFKVIKDRVDPPKTTSRQEVMERYNLVFKHDRAGRLVDAQEFEHLSFDRGRFSEKLLAELLAAAPNTVSVTGEYVVIKHLYTERRLTPLNLYIKETSPAEAGNAVLDYGKAIKDLAATNIFPGDVLLKNFGVTRHGRVVFYDYDELCLLTECKFRKLPQARDLFEEFEADPWFYVGPMDIFPEEFRTFLGLQEPLRSLFIGAHEDLFGIEFWRSMQARHQAGEVVNIFPYPESKHLINS